MLKSIKGKIILWNATVLISVLVAAELLSYFYLRDYLYSKFDATLRAECVEMKAGIVYRNGKLGHFDEDEWEEREHVEFGEHALYVQITGETGETVRQTQNMINLGLVFGVFGNKNPASPEYRNQRVSDHTFRMAELPLVHSGKNVGWITAAILLDDVEDFLASMINAFLIFTPICIGIALFGIWRISLRSLKPIARIANIAGQIIESGDLNVRIDDHRPDEELAKLVSTLNHLFAKLEDSFEQIKQFSANASHELRTPLTILRGHIEVCLSRERTAIEYRETLTELLDEVLRMSGIVNNLLLLARIDADSAPMEMTVVKLDELVRENLEQMALIGKKHKIAIECDICQPIEVVGNTRRLSEVLLNLLDNAIKYNRDGGTVTVSLTAGGEQAVLKISDNGIGIPREDQDKIFERFYRVDKARSREYGGSGLGLAIVKWIVDEHNGSISVSSDPGKGSCFTITFPSVVYEPN